MCLCWVVVVTSRLSCCFLYYDIWPVLSFLSLLWEHPYGFYYKRFGLCKMLDLIHTQPGIRFVVVFTENSRFCVRSFAHMRYFLSGRQQWSPGNLDRMEILSDFNCVYDRNQLFTLYIVHKVFSIYNSINNMQRGMWASLSVEINMIKCVKRFQVSNISESSY